MIDTPALLDAAEALAGLPFDPEALAMTDGDRLDHAADLLGFIAENHADPGAVARIMPEVRTFLALFGGGDGK